MSECMDKLDSLTLTNVKKNRKCEPFVLVELLRRAIPFSSGGPFDLFKQLRDLFACVGGCGRSLAIFHVGDWLVRQK